MKRCAHCQTEVQEGWVVCPKCQKSLSSAPSAMDGILKELQDTKESLLQKLKDADKLRVDEKAALELKLKETEDKILTRVETVEKRIADSKVTVPGLADELKNWSWIRAIAAIVTKNFSKAGFEAEVFKASSVHIKDYMGIDSGGGNYVIPEELYNEIVPLMQAKSVTQRLGITTLTNLVGAPLRIPKQKGGVVTYWIGEDTEITSSKITLGLLELSPKRNAALMPVDNLYSMLANPSVDAFAKNDMAKALAAARDYVNLFGKGTQFTPKGLVKNSKVPTLSLAAGGVEFTFDHALDMEGVLEDADALDGNLGFAIAAKCKRVWKKQKVAQYAGDLAGQFIILPMSDANIEQSVGYKVIGGTKFPVTSALSYVIFGNWIEQVEAQWSTIVLSQDSGGEFFKKDQTCLKMVQYIDCGQRSDESFVYTDKAKTIKS